MMQALSNRSRAGQRPRELTRAYEHGRRSFDALEVMLEPALVEHPDFHDGWGEMRLREVSLDQPKTPRPRLLVTTRDHGRLSNMLARPDHAEGCEVARGLEADLNEAEIVCPTRIPPQVVTMNSSVIFENQHTGTQHRAQLVYPHQCLWPYAQVSVLDPLGRALLGRARGEHAMGAWRIVAVPFQPEAAGCLHL